MAGDQPCPGSPPASSSGESAIDGGGIGDEILSDLLELIKVYDPDMMLFQYSDTRVPFIVKRAKCYGLDPTFSHSNRFKQMVSV